MTYKETVAWMFAQLPMYQKQGKAAIKPKLTNSINFSRHLNHPEKQFKAVHIAGTNGKGSSSHMLASVLQEAGYKVGLYTSPHLKDFRERIKIDGTMISEQEVIDFICENRSFLEDNALSFFEMTVGMAFHYFAAKEVAIAIIEVGLGGRLDSTNIIVPEVSLITNIGLDHTAMLGNTLPEIAKEKAGIIKSRIPVVVSEFEKTTFSVFEAIAKQKEAPLINAENEPLVDYKTDLQGTYQQKNVRGVLCVIKHLKGFHITSTHIKNGLLRTVQNTGIKGRWQQLNTSPRVICDTAHNKEGLSIVLKQLQAQQFKKLHMVIGFVNDKNIAAILSLFPKKAMYYFCAPSMPRALPVKNLLDKANNYELEGNGYSTVKEAFIAAQKNATSNDLIFIGGSTFVVAEIV